MIATSESACQTHGPCYRLCSYTNGIILLSVLLHLLQPTLASTLPSPSAIIVVDSINGSDVNCSRSNITGGVASASPCSTLTKAFSLIQPNDWITLLPGRHVSSTLNVTVSSFTISSFVPSAVQLNLPSASQALLQAGGVSVWDCMNSRYCLYSNSTTLVPTFAISGLKFERVATHAIVSFGGDVWVENCNFDQVAGVIDKNAGNVYMNGTTLANSPPSPMLSNISASYIQGLINIRYANFFMNNCSVFNCFRNYTGAANWPGGGTISIRNGAVLNEVRITNSQFRNNLISNLVKRQSAGLPFQTGGAAIEINTACMKLTITDCVFQNNSHGAVSGSQGGAVAISFSPFDASAPSFFIGTILRNNFTRNRIFNAPGVISNSLRDGGALSLSWNSLESSTFGYLTAGAQLTFQDNQFFNNSAGGRGGGAFLYNLISLQADRNIFVGNSASTSGAGFSLTNRLDVTYPTYTYNINNCTFMDNHLSIDGDVRDNVGGAAFAVINFPVKLSITDCTFLRNTVVGGLGGHVSVSSPGSCTFQRCRFEQGTADVGGAVSNTGAAELTFNDCDFIANVARILGGAIYARTAVLTVQTCQFFSNIIRMYSSADSTGSDGAPAQFKQSSFFRLHEGAAISANSGQIFIFISTFANNINLPEGGMEACEGYLENGLAYSTDFRGGAVALSQMSLLMHGTVFEYNQACAAASMLYKGQEDLTLIDNGFYFEQAVHGASIILDSVYYASLYEGEWRDCYSTRSGGAALFVNTNSFSIELSTFTNCTSLRGDGGALFVVGNDANEVEISSTDFRNCSAPLGAGGIMFYQINPQKPEAAMGLLEFDNYFGNTVGYPPIPSIALYGPAIASDLSLLIPSVSQLEGSPGLTLPSISFQTIDAYGNNITMDRGYVFEASLLPNSDGTLPLAGSGVYGTLLQKVDGTSGVATFADLSVRNPPGEYVLRFSVVSTNYYVLINLTLTTSCPTSEFYDPILLSCRHCGADFLVYNRQVGQCLPCAISYFVSKSADGQQVCLACPLGFSSSGSLCHSCPLNSFQSAPGEPCTSCLGDDKKGLHCGNDLPQVQQGYFAYSALDPATSRQTIVTAECPLNFCSGGFVQYPWLDNGTLINPDTSTSIPPNFTSAVTRFDQQCAFPRRATADNLLCGECEPPYTPWGSNCSRCDKVNAGLMFAIILLSMVLVLSLLRGASQPAEAGHSVILVYFIQIAMLEVGSASNLLLWLNIALFSPNSTTECLAPLSVYDQVSLQIVLPLLLLTQLVFIMFLHFSVSRLRHSTGQAQMTEKEAEQFASASRANTNKTFQFKMKRLKFRFLLFIDSFAMDVYVSAGLSILLFCYTNVTVATLSTLYCVDVGGVSVVFTQPTMRCSSDEYKHLFVLVMFSLVVFVIGFPLGVLLFLWRNRERVKAAHKLIDARAEQFAAQESVENAASIEQGSSSSAGVPSVAVVPSSSPVPDSRSSTSEINDDSRLPTSFDSSVVDVQLLSAFTLRYSPLFSMYTFRAYFWSVFVLIRRTALVAISVALVRKSAERYLAFFFAHFASLLLQLQFKPFSVDFFNQAEVVSHIFLILMSTVLLAYQPPLATGTSVVLFLLVVPPLLIYAGLAIYGKWSSVTAKRQAKLKRLISQQQEIEEMEYELNKLTNQSRGVRPTVAMQLEMMDLGSSSLRPSSATDITASSSPYANEARIRAASQRIEKISQQQSILDGSASSTTHSEAI